MFSFGRWKSEGHTRSCKVTVCLFCLYKQQTQSSKNKHRKTCILFISKLYFQSHCYRIYQNDLPYLEISTVSVNATTSDLSFVTVKSPIPISATPLLTSDTIPFHEPLADLEPYETVSWTTVLLAGVRN